MLIALTRHGCDVAGGRQVISGQLIGRLGAPVGPLRLLLLARAPRAPMLGLVGVVLVLPDDPVHGAQLRAHDPHQVVQVADDVHAQQRRADGEDVEVKLEGREGVGKRDK